MRADLSDVFELVRETMNTYRSTPVGPEDEIVVETILQVPVHVCYNGAEWLADGELARHGRLHEATLDAVEHALKKGLRTVAHHRLLAYPRGTA